jgi:hypothetical protein
MSSTIEIIISNKIVEKFNDVLQELLEKTKKIAKVFDSDDDVDAMDWIFSVRIANKNRIYSVKEMRASGMHSDYTINQVLQQRREFPEERIPKWRIVPLEYFLNKSIDEQLKKK